jgi:aminotransferase
MSLSLSSRAELTAQAEIRVMSIECEKVGGINLAQGVCDLPVPAPIRTAACAAMRDGVNSYTRYDGLAELRNAISIKLRDHNGIAADPDSEIIVSAGSTGAFYCACLSLLEPGDEVIVFEPYYGYHVSTLEAAGAVPVFVRMEPPAWTFALRDVEKKVTRRTRAVVVNTPSNPCGKVFSQTELNLLADFAESHDLFVFTDEIYEYIIYDGRRHLSPAIFPGMAERTITISGFSKTFNITGWRLGYSAGTTRWTQAIGHMNDLIYVCAAAPLQLGVAKGMAQLPPDYYQRLAAEYTRKRDRLCSALVAAKLEPYVPQGAYYVLADAGRLPGRSSKQRAMYLLERSGIATVPGDAFYHDACSNLVRFCFAKQEAELEEACARLETLA